MKKRLTLAIGLAVALAVAFVGGALTERHWGTRYLDDFAVLRSMKMGPISVTGHHVSIVGAYVMGGLTIDAAAHDLTISNDSFNGTGCEPLLLLSPPSVPVVPTIPTTPREPDIQPSSTEPKLIRAVSPIGQRDPA